MQVNGSQMVRDIIEGTKRLNEMRDEIELVATTLASWILKEDEMRLGLGHDFETKGSKYVWSVWVRTPTFSYKPFAVVVQCHKYIDSKRAENIYVSDKDLRSQYGKRGGTKHLPLEDVQAVHQHLPLLVEDVMWYHRNEGYLKFLIEAAQGS